jgi:hypothetical protein
MNRHHQSLRGNRITVLFLLLAALGGLRVGECSLLASTNVVPAKLTVKDVQGKPHQPLKHGGEKLTLLFFLMHDCPLARTMAPEINRLVAEYGPRGARSFLVFAEPDLTAAKARRHATDFGFVAPVLLDRQQQLVRFTGATVSPEVAVLSPDNKILYRGRIDDRLTEFGKQRVTPTQRDLRDALETILAGKPVATPVTKAVGCYLPEPRKARSR